MFKCATKLVACLAMAIAVALSALPAEAIMVTNIIDNFHDDSAAITGAAIGSTATSLTIEGALGNIFGTERDVFVIKTSGPTTPALYRKVAAVADGTLPGSFYVDRGPLVNGHVLIQWDGADGSPPAGFDPLSNLAFSAGPWDLTSDVGILMKLTYGEPDQVVQFTLFSSATEASTHAAIPIPNFSGPGSMDILIPFALFAQSLLAGVSSEVDWSDIRAITMTATSSVAGRDLELQLVGTYVPESATACIFGIGSLMALCTFRRFRPNRRRQG